MTRSRLGRGAGVGAVLATVVALGAACSNSAGSGSAASSAPAPAPSAASSSAAPTLAASDVGRTVYESAMQASAVHITGAITQTQGARLDLQLNKDTVSGEVQQEGISVPVLRVKDKYFIKFTPTLMQKAGISESTSVGQQLKNKWVPSTGQIGAKFGEAFKSFLDYSRFIEGILGQLKGVQFSGGEPGTLGDQPTLNYDSSEGKAAVTASEPHYLLRIQDPKNGIMVFSGWDKPTTVTEPPASEVYSGPGT